MFEARDTTTGTHQRVFASVCAACMLTTCSKVVMSFAAWQLTAAISCHSLHGCLLKIYNITVGDEQANGPELQAGWPHG